MRVKLVLKTENTPEGKVNTKNFDTIKEARTWYETVAKGNVILAYIAKFDGWHWYRREILYEEK